jgi:hypothetical protein
VCRASLRLSRGFAVCLHLSRRNQSVQKWILSGNALQFQIKNRATDAIARTSKRTPPTTFLPTDLSLPWNRSSKYSAIRLIMMTFYGARRRASEIAKESSQTVITPAVRGKEPLVRVTPFRERPRLPVPGHTGRQCPALRFLEGSCRRFPGGRRTCRPLPA